MTDYHQDKLAIMMMVRMMLIVQRVPVEQNYDIQLVLIEDIFGQKYRNIQSIQPDLPRPPVPIVHHNEPTFEGNF